jgi:hypothetical protein
MRILYLIILVSTLFGCRSEQGNTVRPEAELEATFNDLIATFKSGNDQVAIGFYLSPKRGEWDTRLSSATKLVGEAIRSKNSITLQDSKVIGRHGVILIAEEGQDSVKPMYALMTAKGWKFMPGFAMWSNQPVDFGLELSESDKIDGQEITKWVAEQAKSQ